MAHVQAHLAQGGGLEQPDPVSAGPDRHGAPQDAPATGEMDKRAFVAALACPRCGRAGHHRSRRLFRHLVACDVGPQPTIVDTNVEREGTRLIRTLLEERAAAKLPKLKVLECHEQKDCLELPIRGSEQLGNI